MRSTSPANPSPRRRKASLAALLALCALAAGVQAFAPASAGAVANQLTDCTPGSGITGYGIDRAGNICYLGGGEVIVVDPGPCPNPRDCVTDQHTAPAEAGSDSGLRIGPGGRPKRPWNPAGKSKPVPKWQAEQEREAEKKKERDDRLAAMSAEERRRKERMCSSIPEEEKKLGARLPKNVRQLDRYYRGYEAYWRYGVKRRGAKTDWEFNVDLHRQLDAYKKYLEDLSRLHDAEIRAECWLFKDREPAQSD